MQCGFDLARQRATLDPHYGLPLAICPRCGWTCVRRDLLLANRYRAIRRATEALALLVLQGTLILLFTSVNCLNAIGLDEWSLEPRGLAWARRNWEYLAWAIIVVPHLTGAWLMVAFDHRRRVTVFLLWTTWLLAWMLVPAIVIPALGRFFEAPTPANADPMLWYRAMNSLVSLGILLAASLLIGAPFGGFYGALKNRRGRVRHARIRRRIRKRRSGP